MSSRPSYIQKMLHGLHSNKKDDTELVVYDYENESINEDEEEIDEEEESQQTEEEIQKEENERNEKQIQNEFMQLKRILITNEMMLNQIFHKLDFLCNKMEVMEEKIQLLETHQKSNFIEIDGEIIRVKELKNERINLPEEEVIRILIFRDYRSVLAIFKSYYQSVKGERIFYPIRMKTKRNYEYFYKNQWIHDANGHFITKTLCNNIQNLFLKYNQIDSRFLNEEHWYLNQQFISKLSDEKYKKEIWNHIKDEIALHA